MLSIVLHTFLIKHPVAFINERPRTYALFVINKRSVSNLSILPQLLCKHLILYITAISLVYAIGSVLLMNTNDFLFRNIAARSCLFGDGGAIKLAEFSLCSKLDPLRTNSSRFAVPVKWTAPEVLSADGKSVSRSNGLLEI